MIRTLPFLFLVACGGKDTDSATTSTPSVDPLSFAVDAPGPYNAGFRAWDISYDVLGESRTITLNVWYPTEATSGNSVTYAGISPDDNAYGDAEAAAPLHNGTYALHAHSHGHQGYGGTSSEMMRHFASHGWVSVAPDHIGNLLTDNPDNEVAHFDALRPMDVKAVVDALAALPADDPLSAVATDTYLLSGHSRGSTTTWSLLGATYDPGNPGDYCEGCDAPAMALFTDGSVVDSRAVAAIPMASGFNTSTYGPTGWSPVTAPVMLMTGSLDNAQSAQDTWDSVTLDNYAWLELEGGCHQTFALGVCSTLDVPDGFWMVDTYAMAFARHHLLGDEDAQTVGLLDGSIELDPRAVYQAK